MTSSVRSVTLSVTSGASSTPARAASEEPSAQESCETRSGLVPASAASSGSSTTARIAIPSRVLLKNSRSATATVTAVAMTSSWFQSMTSVNSVMV